MLAFAPHPLDFEMGMGGTIARLIQEGKEIVSVICTNGDKGSSDPSMKPQDLEKIREREELAAAKILGVKEVIFLRHNDLGNGGYTRIQERDFAINTGVPSGNSSYL